MKKGLCFILSIIIVLSIFAINVNATSVDYAESGKSIDEAEVGADINISDVGAALRTQAEAVAWITARANEGWWEDVDKAFGCQCVDLVMAYYEYFGYSRMSGNGKDYKTGHLPSGSGWSYSSSPVPGCIFVKDGDREFPEGHVGLVYAVSGSTMNTVETNLVAPWDGGYPYAKAKYHTRNVSSAVTFIVPTFKNAASKPTNAWIKVANTSIPTGNNNTFTFGATNASSYNIRIEKGGSLWKSVEKVSSGVSYTFTEEGSYTAYITAVNSGGNTDSSKVNFKVFEPVILGRDFVAQITNSKAGKNIVADTTGNVILANKSESDTQLWHFELQSDCSYKITNKHFNKCLDVSGGSPASDTNIQIYTDNGTVSQRFYIRYNNIGFGIVPKLNTNLALDMHNGSLDDGTNIWDCTWNQSNAQTFSIDGYYGTSPVATSVYNGHTYEYYDIETTWNQAYRICENKGGHLVTITSKEENDFVYNLCKGKCKMIWIGATVYNKDASKANWYWITGESFSYDGWTSGEPNFDQGEERYGVMMDTGKWNDTRLNYSALYYTSNKVRGFVCEYDNGNVNADKYTASATTELNGTTYEVFDYAVDWQTAQAICEAKGGHLVTIGDSKENEIIVSLAKKGNKSKYWINATDRNSEGIWTDHEGNLLIYINWLADEPNNDFNAEQYAVIAKSDGKWYDIKGFSPMYRSVGFICEYEPKITYLGDADDDGTITILDVTVIQRRLAGMTTSSYNEVAADVNGDGETDIIDATYIQRYLAGFSDSFNIGKPI